ncbi:MAG: hypothetical protein Q8P67_18960, partial [archaeon]|nr:hypothetical protein [archaeon]
YSNLPQRHHSEIFARPHAPTVFTSLSCTLNLTSEIPDHPPASVRKPRPHFGAGFFSNHLDPYAVPPRHRSFSGDSLSDVLLTAAEKPPPPPSSIGDLTRSRSFEYSPFDRDLKDSDLDSLSTSHLSLLATEPILPIVPIVPLLPIPLASMTATSTSSAPNVLQLVLKKKPQHKVRKIRASTIVSKYFNNPKTVAAPSAVSLAHSKHDFADQASNSVPLTPRPIAPLQDLHATVRAPRPSDATRSLSRSLQTPTQSAFSRISQPSALTLQEREKVVALQVKSLNARIARVFAFIADRRRGLPIPPDTAATMIQRAWRANRFRKVWPGVLLASSNCLNELRNLIRTEHLFFAQLSALISVLTPWWNNNKFSSHSSPRTQSFLHLVSIGFRLFDLFSAHVGALKSISFPLPDRRSIEGICLTLQTEILPALHEYHNFFPEGLIAFAKILKEDKRFSKNCNTETVKELLPIPVRHFKTYEITLLSLSQFPLTSAFQKCLPIFRL